MNPAVIRRFDSLEPEWNDGGNDVAKARNDRIDFRGIQKIEFSSCREIQTEMGVSGKHSSAFPFDSVLS